MGTSLSGLTPATTFDGLLKTSDNEPLDGTLKTISDGSGVDSVLQLSDSALSIGGATTIVGTGNDASTTALLVKNSDGTELLKVNDNNQIYFGNLIGSKIQLDFINTRNNAYTIFRTHAGDGNGSFYQSVGVGQSTTPTARLHIKGSGATSATTSLLVQNSAGTQALKVTDDGAVAISDDGIVINGQLISRSGTKIQLGAAQLDYQVQSAHTFKTYNGTSYTEVMRITGNTADQFVGIGESTPTARLHIKGSGNDNTTTSLLVQNSDGADLFKVFDGGGIRINTETLSSTIIGKNGTGGAFVVDAGKVNNIRVDVNGVAINSTTSANTSFKVKGSGATSATTALLVQNSAGTDLLKVEDGGDVNIDNGVAADMKVRISPTTNKYLEIDRQGRQVRYYSGASGNAGIYMVQADKFSIGTNNTSLVLLDENSNVRIGSGITSADTSAKLQVDSTTKGFLPPRMTTTERDAIATPAAGLMVYNTTTNKAQCYNGTTWNDLF